MQKLNFFSSSKEVVKMFIWEFAADLVLGQIVNWVYNQVVGFLGNFLAEMGSSVRDKKGTNQQLVPFSKFSLS